MPYNPNPPKVAGSAPLRHGTKPWPYNPTPLKGYEWSQNNYTTTQAQADQYSHLAQKFESILRTSTGIPGAGYWTAQRLYDRMRRERLLPAFGKSITPAVVKRVQNFGRNVLNLRGLKMSVYGLEQILIGESP